MKDQWTIKLLLLLNKIEIPIIFLSVAELGHHQKVVKIPIWKNIKLKHNLKNGTFLAILST